MKSVLVTGGSKGIGKAISIKLAIDYHWHILINYSKDKNEALATLSEVQKFGGTGELLQFDVANKVEVDKVIDEWNKNNADKYIYALINNAGITRDGLFMWMNEQNWNDVIDISLNGFYNVTQNVLRGMMLNKSGRIVNLSSISGIKGVAGQTNYSAAKAGLIGATKSLATEIAKMNITVNAVAPGFIRTKMTDDLNVEQYMKFIPSGRIGETNEVADLVSFLVSDKAAYITGQVIGINGGLN